MGNQSNNLSISCFTLQRITEIFNDLFSLCTVKEDRKKKKEKKTHHPLNSARWLPTQDRSRTRVKILPHYFSLFVAPFKLSETINLKKEC